MSRKPSDGRTYDDLMAEMGVKPLASKGRATAGGQKKSPKRGARARSAPRGRTQQTPPARAPVAPPPPPVTEPGPTDPQAVAAGPPPPAEPEPSVGVAALERELHDLRVRHQQQTDDLAATQEELAREQSARQELDVHRRSLQRALGDAQGPAPESPPPLAKLLEDRGLMGADEHRRLFAALSELRLLEQLVKWLEPSDSPSVARVLDERVALLGGCDDCPAAPGRAIVRVPKERCEVCQGSDIRRSVRHFVDACLNLGLTRVTVVGGSPKYHRQLKELVNHRQLSLALVPGNVRRTQKQADHDIAASDVVLLWGGTLLDHSTSELYRGDKRVLTIPHRGIARMLQQATHALVQRAG